MTQNLVPNDIVDKVNNTNLISVDGISEFYLLGSDLNFVVFFFLYILISIFYYFFFID